MAAPQHGKGTNKLKIAVIPGDGIGNEVVPEGIKVLETISGEQAARTSTSTPPPTPFGSPRSK